VNKVLLILRLISAAILLQTLFFKFTGAAESVAIFTKMQMEPWGRWGTGMAELIASIGLFIPATAIYASILVQGLMLGAIFSHVFVLGIVVENDGGLLFSLALIAWITSLLYLFFKRRELFGIIQKITKSTAA